MSEYLNSVKGLPSMSNSATREFLLTARSFSFRYLIEEYSAGKMISPLVYLKPYFSIMTKMVIPSSVIDSAEDSM